MSFPLKSFLYHQNLGRLLSPGTKGLPPASNPINLVSAVSNEQLASRLPELSPSLFTLTTSQHRNRRTPVSVLCFFCVWGILKVSIIPRFLRHIELPQLPHTQRSLRQSPAHTTGKSKAIVKFGGQDFIRLAGIPIRFRTPRTTHILA